MNKKFVIISLIIFPVIIVAGFYIYWSIFSSCCDSNIGSIEDTINANLVEAYSEKFSSSPQSILLTQTSYDLLSSGKLEFYLLYQNKGGNEVKYSFCTKDCASDCFKLNSSQSEKYEKSISFVLPKIKDTLQPGEIDAKKIELKTSNTPIGVYTGSVCIKNSNNEIFMERIKLNVT